MTDGLPFGTRVLVAATVRPCYIKATTRVETRHPVDPGFGLAFDRIEVSEGPLRHVPADHYRPWAPDELGPDGAPGHPLPDADPLPDRPGIYRRLRRFPFPHEGASAIIVGRTWRVEGQYHDGRTTYDGEIDPAYLTTARRVEVLEIALDPGDVGRLPWPATLALAIPDDVHPQESHP